MGNAIATPIQKLRGSCGGAANRKIGSINKEPQPGLARATVSKRFDCRVFLATASEAPAITADPSERRNHMGAIVLEFLEIAPFGFLYFGLEILLSAGRIVMAFVGPFVTAFAAVHFDPIA